MSWGPELHVELAELFLEAYQRTPRRKRIPVGCDQVRSRPNETRSPDGLCSAQRELLEALLVERRVHRAGKRCGLGSGVERQAVEALERAGLVRVWHEPRGKQTRRMAEVTQAGWGVLLGQQCARR